jgi:hypothetical protein
MRNYKQLKHKSKEYEELFKNGEIVLAKCNDKLCKKCQIIKPQTIENFYLRLIKYKNGEFVPVFNTYCISCLNIEQKHKGKLYSSRIYELKYNVRTCKKCGLLKELNDQNFRLTQKKYLRRVCLDCDRANANELTKKRLVYARDSIRASKRKYQANRRKTDPVYRMRKYISTQIYLALRKNNSRKNGSIMSHLLYTIGELKNHIEKQFESWMTWDNMGKYNSKTWDDNNISTWTWNIDHIIPQCMLPYTSMSDDNFKKCWAMENLRPRSAKNNILDGVRLAHRVK